MCATAALSYMLENRLGEVKEHERSQSDSAEKLGFKSRLFQFESLSVPSPRLGGHPPPPGMEYTLLPEQRAAYYRAEMLAPQGPWSFP